MSRKPGRRIRGANRSDFYDKRTLAEYAEENGLGMHPLEYRNIAYKVFEKMREKLMNGHEVVLPHYMGRLKIMGQVKEIKEYEEGKFALPTDWKTTMEMWKTRPETRNQIFYHLNEHTDNTVYGLRWITNGLKLKNKLMYKTKTYIGIKHDLRDIILSGDYHYDLLYKTDGTYPKMHLFRTNEQAL